MKYKKFVFSCFTSPLVKNINPFYIVTLPLLDETETKIMVGFFFVRKW